MKKLFLMLALGSVSYFGIAQSTSVNTTAPTTATSNAKIEFVSETIDYGTIENGANGEREFKFKNAGTDALIISTCRGSCGCTVPTCPTEPIMPKQSGVIKVKYDTSRTGQFTKQITVESNDPSGIKILKIQGNVNAPATTPATTTVAPH
jgi:hypothetical protein